jgi:hypothetical protein
MDFKLEDIKDLAILDLGATRHIIVIYSSVKGVKVASDPSTVTIPNVS